MLDGRCRRLHKVAEEHIKKERWNQAIGRYLRILFRSPEDVRAHFNLGNIYANLEKFAEAVPYFRRAAELDPSDDEALCYLGASYFCLEQFTEAEETLRSSLALDDCLDCVVRLGHVLEVQEKLQEAETLWREALERYPSEPRLSYYLGSFLAKRGDCREALDFFLDALTDDDLCAEACFRRGSCFSGLHEWTPALEAFTESSMMREEWQDEYNIGVCNMNLGHTQEAIVAMKKALELNPTEGRIQYLLWKWYNKIGNHEAAKQYEYIPDEAKIRFVLRLPVEPETGTSEEGVT